jgi:hypothetical protein
MESDPRNGDIVVKLPTYISLALGSAVIRSLLGELPMDGTAGNVWDAIGLTPRTLGEDVWGSGGGGGGGGGGVKTSSVGEIFERIRQLQPPEEDEDESDVGSDNDGSDDDDGLGSVIEEDTT